MRKLLNNHLSLPVAMLLIALTGVVLIAVNPGKSTAVTTGQLAPPTYSGGVILLPGHKSTASLNGVPAGSDTATVSQPNQDQPAPPPGTGGSDLQAKPCSGAHKFGLQPSCARLYCPEVMADGYGLPCNGCGAYLDGGDEYACRMY